MESKRHIQVTNRDLGGETTLSLTCWRCNRVKELKVPTKGYDAWIEGEYIQNTLSGLSPGDREFLISGTCEPCFDRLFGE